jgi:CheY-like chemotaxis protein
MDKASKTILVIDDSEVALEVITDDLTAAGFSVMSARSGKEAEQIIASGYHPDLILLDIMMPGMNGDEFCKTVKSRPETADIPIVFVSTKEDSELREMIRRAGANGYIRKAVLTSGGLSMMLEKFLKENQG